MIDINKEPWYSAILTVNSTITNYTYGFVHIEYPPEKANELVEFMELMRNTYPKFDFRIETRQGNRYAIFFNKI